MTLPRLRPVCTGDADGLAEVHAAAWRVAYRGLLPDEALERSGRAQRLLLWRGLLADPARLPWVDVVLEAAAPGTPARERIVGFVWSRLTGQSGAAFEAEIVGINVHPDRWRRGLGRRLLAAAAGRLEEAGAASVYLWVFEENRPARAFYDSIGGRIVDTGSDTFGDAAVPTLAYAWKPLSTLLRAVAR